MLVQAGVAAQRDAVVAAALLHDEAGALQLAVHADRAAVGGRRVVGGLEDERRGQLPVVHRERAQRWHRPVRARRVVPGVVPGHERRLLVDAPAVVAPGAPVLGPAGVTALDGGVDRVAVVAARVGRAEVLVHLDQRLGVPVLHVRGERLGEIRPVAVVVATGQEGVLQFARADRAARGLARHVRPHPVPGGLDAGRVGAQAVRGVVLRDPGGERLVPVVEGVVLAEVALVPDVVRIDDGVQDQAAHPLRVELGVDRAEVGAVGVAEVVDLPRAQRPADHVEVLGRADRVHVRQHVAVLLAAGTGERLGPVPVDPLGPVRGGHRVRTHRVEVAGHAVQRRSARADPARVETDHVVLGRHLLRQRRGHESGHGQTAAARSARVDQQRPLGLLRGVRNAGQGERDLAAGGAAVVQRGADLRALEPRGALGGAVGPLQLRGGRRARGGGGGRTGRGGQQTGDGRTDGDQNSCTFRHGASRSGGTRRRITGPRRMLPESRGGRARSARIRPVRSRHRPHEPSRPGARARSLLAAVAPIAQARGTPRTLSSSRQSRVSWVGPDSGVAAGSDGAGGIRRASPRWAGPIPYASANSCT